MKSCRYFPQTTLPQGVYNTGYLSLMSTYLNLSSWMKYARSDDRPARLFLDRGERRGGKLWVEEGEALEVLLVDGRQHVRVGGSERRRGRREELVEVFPFSAALLGASRGFGATRKSQWDLGCTWRSEASDNVSATRGEEESFGMEET